MSVLIGQIFPLLYLLCCLYSHIYHIQSRTYRYIDKMHFCNAAARRFCLQYLRISPAFTRWRHQYWHTHLTQQSYKQNIHIITTTDDDVHQTLERNHNKYKSIIPTYVRTEQTHCVALQLQNAVWTIGQNHIALCVLIFAKPLELFLFICFFLCVCE